MENFDHESFKVAMFELIRRGEVFLELSRNGKFDDVFVVHEDRAREALDLIHKASGDGVERPILWDGELCHSRFRRPRVGP